jgi:hypothetical protein
MSEINATVIDGQIVPDAPPAWPNGTRVAVKPVGQTGDDLPDDDDSSPEAIAKRLALMDRVRPWMTPDEFAEWERVRAENKAFQLSQWGKWTKDIEDLFK